jgi:hypothetical protein
MGQGISAILTFAIGVAISPVPIIAVILMLFSDRAKVNGPAFLVGWVLSLAAVSTVIYVLAHDGNVATSSTAADSVSWGKIALGVGLLALARRNWRKRPAPGAPAEMPKWLATVESVSPRAPPPVWPRFPGSRPRTQSSPSPCSLSSPA